ncbi:MAG: hypothetical protein CK527_05565 [Nitrosarchaeum sp.]|nr:hypothetical protein [Nitrosarchaeum sp.]MDW7641201.1 hypothetical protein [Nitrosarchaeum sp.]PHY08599.1 MAG: hypothetical protein CK527_05565 [Nitrosarchaeum sp.]
MNRKIGLVLSGKQEPEIFDELMAIEQDMLDCVENLLSVNWDSNSMKLEIQELVKQRSRLRRELFDLDNKSGT